MESNYPRYAVVIGWYTNPRDAETRADLAEKKGIHAVVVDRAQSDADFPDPVRDLQDALTGKIDELIRAISNRGTTAPELTPTPIQKKPFWRFLADYLKAHNMTQAELAVNMGVSPSAVSNWIGGRVISVTSLKLMRHLFDDVPDEYWDLIDIPIAQRRTKT